MLFLSQSPIGRWCSALNDSMPMNTAKSANHFPLKFANSAGTNRSLIRWAIIGWAAAIIALSLIGQRTCRLSSDFTLSEACPR